MPKYFQTPEAALKQACDALEGRAEKWPTWNSLQSFIKNKARLQISKTSEQIVLKYLELCADLDQGLEAKDGLYQYRYICQQANIKSLVDVIRAYLTMAEGKTETAREESQRRKRALDTNIQTPECVLLSAVSGEDAHDRVDHFLLAPRVKFLMDSYRHCLDLTNNSKMERFHHEVAQQAFRWCLQHNCKNDFQTLCESMRFKSKQTRQHNLNTAIKLDNPDSQSMLLQTRLLKLDTAISMELWQEVFKSAEDIQSLFTSSMKTLKSVPKLMADYHKKMAVAFWKCGNVLFHAATLHRHLSLSVESRNLTLEDRQRMSTRVLVATLSIPVTPERTDSFAHFLGTEGVKEKHCKLANIGLQSIPTRQSLINDVMNSNIQQYVAPEVKELFSCLEVDVNPLKLSGIATKVLNWAERETDLQKYVPHLQSNTVIRLLQQVSQVYQSMELNHLASMLPFLNGSMEANGQWIVQLEQSIVEAARHCDLQVRIDHASHSLTFGPFPQDVQIGSQLAAIYSSLSKAIQVIRPDSIQQECELQRQQAFADYLNNGQEERERILARRRTRIEDRKEHLESLQGKEEQEQCDAKMQKVRKAEEERLHQEAIDRQKALKAEAEKRLQQEVKDREMQRILQEKNEVEKKKLRDRLEQMKKTEVGAKAFKNVDVESIKDLDFLVAKQVEQIKKDKKQLQDRLKKQWKTVSTIERAKHMEEVPLLKKARMEQLDKDREMWKIQEEERICQIKLLHEKNLETKKRLSRMTGDVDGWRYSISESHHSVYEAKLKTFNERMDKEKNKRLEERKMQRKENRRKAYRQQKEQDARRIEEEQLRKAQEERQRIEQEQREEEDRRYQERLRKLEVQAAKQRARQQEIEERERLREQERRSPPGAVARTWRRDGRKDDNGEREPASRLADATRSSWRGGGEEEHHGSPRRFDKDAFDNNQGSPHGFDKVFRRGADRPGGWRDRVKAKEEAGEGEDRPKERHPQRDDRGGFWRRGGTDDVNKQASWRRDKRQLAATNC